MKKLAMLLKIGEIQKFIDKSENKCPQIFLCRFLFLYLYYNKLTITQYDIPNNIPNIDSIKLDFFKSNVFSKRVPRSFKSKTPYYRHHDGIITSSKFNLFCGNFGVQYTTLYRKYRINRQRPQ